jgi:hypothetical protein
MNLVITAKNSFGRSIIGQYGIQVQILSLLPQVFFQLPILANFLWAFNVINNTVKNNKPLSKTGVRNRNLETSSG